jgi:hypothetical protein
MPSNLFKFIKCPAPTHRKVLDRVRNKDRPSLRDEEYAKVKYMERKITFEEYIDVLNFMPIYHSAHERKIKRVSAYIIKVTGQVPTHSRIIKFLNMFED